MGKILFFGQDLAALQRRHAGVGDDVRTEVQHLFQNARGQIEDQTHARRDALEVPDVAHGRGQLDVAHALAADFCARDFHAAAVADLALIADLLIFNFAFSSITLSYCSLDTTLLSYTSIL